MKRLFDLFSRNRQTKHSEDPLADLDFNPLYKILSYKFRDESLLREALTHRSFSVSRNYPSNQRMEFLGDAVLELVSSHVLYENFPDKEEGPLTEARSALVKGSNLAKIAQKLGLGDFLLLSVDEKSRDGGSNPSILADVYEAISGAIYLDGGYKSAEKFIKKTLLVDLVSAFDDAKTTNHKSRLLEYLQANALGNAKYKVVGQSGPDHAKVFDVEVVLNDESLGRGTGKRLKEAEQKAAEKALQHIENMNKKSAVKADSE